jgi:hypothetical protein
MEGRMMTHDDRAAYIRAISATALPRCLTPTLR